jgi:hypothetical protein
VEDEADQNDASQQITWKGNIFCPKVENEDREEDMNIGLSSSRVVVVNEAPLRGMERLHKSTTFDSD